MGSLFLGLLVWQGNRICAKVDTLDLRMDTLEIQQTRILTRLDMSLAGAYTPEIGVKTTFLGPWERIKRIKPGENTPEDTRKIQDFVLDLPMVTVVDLPSLSQWNSTSVH